MLRKPYGHTALCITASIFNINNFLQYIYTAEARGIKGRMIPEVITKILSSWRRFLLALTENWENSVEGRILNTMFCP